MESTTVRNFRQSSVNIEPTTPTKADSSAPTPFATPDLTLRASGSAFFPSLIYSLFLFESLLLPVLFRLQ
jgi:hypothetical protein